MPKERTEEEMVMLAPLKLRFGAKEYEIPVLTVPQAPGWREKVRSTMEEIGAMGVSVAGIGTAFIAFPEKVCSLVIAYSPEILSQDTFKTASEEQVVIAFSTMVSVSFPFLRLLSLMKPISQASPLASASSTSSSSSNTDSSRIM